jgi:hypothetical protein
VFLPTRHHHTGGEFIPKFGGKNDAPFFVEPGGVSAEKHASPLSSGQIQVCLHFTPPSTTNLENQAFLA